MRRGKADRRSVGGARVLIAGQELCLGNPVNARLMHTVKR